MIKIKVPATTANMGPGFDSIGMALTLYNEIGIESSNDGIDFIEHGPSLNIPLKDNLILNTILYVFKKYNFKCNGFKIHSFKNDIPLSRGLGSSAACIASGIAAADYMMGQKMATCEKVSIASVIEGHPDNVTPAIAGGMTVSIMNGEKTLFSRINISKDFKFAVMIPEFKISTNDARKVLPESYSRDDCVYNISRAAMLVNAFISGEKDKLRISLNDKIHQPYRKKLIRGIDDIFSKCRNYGSLGEFISGSGSTLISIIERDNTEFEKNMRIYLPSISGNWRIIMLDTDEEGCRILKI